MRIWIGGGVFAPWNSTVARIEFLRSSKKTYLSARGVAPHCAALLHCARVPPVPFAREWMHAKLCMGARRSAACEQLQHGSAVTRRTRE
jgi:hypothetical protein